MNIDIQSFFKLFGDFEPKNIFNSEELLYIHDTLLRKEEFELSNPDEWGNWDVVHETKTFQEPLIDQLITTRLKKKGITQKGIWPDNKPFAVCFTHDIDRIESYSPKTFVRNIKKRRQHELNQTVKFILILIQFKTWIKGFFPKRNDKLWCIENWTELELKYGVRSTFFFFVRPNKKNLSKFDCDYKLSDKFKLKGKIISVKEFIQTLSAEGNEIGLHGSFHSFDNEKLLKEQKDVLETIIQTPIISTRQHYLHFNIEKTPKAQISSNLKVDSTLGYNNSNGFRTGTTFPYYFVHQNNKILQISLNIMDSALDMKNHDDFQNAKMLVVDLFEKTSQVGGCLTINFHPDRIHEPYNFELYEYILSKSKELNAATLTCSEISKIVSSCVE